MLRRSQPWRAGNRPGVAAVELAVLLPFLVFIFVITVDFARVFYFYLTITNCAHNGAMYGSLDATHAQDTAGIEAAALADATNLDPQPSVSSTTGVDAEGLPYVEVTVSCAFRMVTNYPGLTSGRNVVRTVRMRVAPTVPRNS